MFVIIINEGRTIVGPYKKRESAQRRADNLLKERPRAITDATVVLLAKDSEYFGKPIGNVINH